MSWPAVAPGGVSTRLVFSADGKNAHLRRCHADLYTSGEYLELFEAELSRTDDEGFLVTDGGRTPVEGLYASGELADGTVHQAIVNAGDGARAALALARGDMSRRYWPAVGERYVDWVVDEGRYGGDGWDDHVEEWFDREVLPAGLDPGSDRARQVRVDPRHQRRAQTHSRGEQVRRRHRRSRRVHDGRRGASPKGGSVADPPLQRGAFSPGGRFTSPETTPMDDPTPPPPTDRVVDLVEREAREEAVDCLDAVQGAPAEDRKAVLRSLRTLAADRPAAVGTVCGALAPFLDDEERSVRLTAAKLLVAVAESDPGAVLPVVPSLADRLADEEEFYYVRARSAEALGYVALEHPDAVDDPEILADLRVGLSFDEPEVKEKLAKALEYVALGDPDRLRHQVSSLAEHLDDGSELVRYHLSTALVAIGCAHPDRLGPARDVLVERLGDESAHVRGRAAEALGLLVRSGSAPDATPEGMAGMLSPEEEPFVVERVRYALDSAGTPDTVGTREGVRSTTAEAVAAIESPDEDGSCPGCGLELPDGAPPMCPRCGAPIQRGDGV